MEAAKEIKNENTTTQGMEDLFLESENEDQELFPHKEQGNKEQFSTEVQAVELVPVSEAARVFGKTRRYISKLAKEGRVRAERNDKNQWIVELESIEEFFQQAGTEELPVPQTENKGNSSVRSLMDQERIKFLEERNKELEQEVRSAHFRLGYLESEMLRNEEKLKLLEDRQYKSQLESVSKLKLSAENQELKEELEGYRMIAKRSTWTRFVGWMLGS
ncbi:MAG: hypothetical protein AB7M93_30700 [Candidatus Obscuribacterales bacterium]